MSHLSEFNSSIRGGGGIVKFRGNWKASSFPASLSLFNFRGNGSLNEFPISCSMTREKSSITIPDHFKQVRAVSCDGSKS